MEPALDASRQTRPTIGLGSWLGGGSALVVAVAVAAMAFACSMLLERLVEGQALARAQLAASSARDLLRRIGEETLSDARVLGERPTLQRLLAMRDDTTGLEFFLRRFCDSSRNDACAIAGAAGPLSRVGPPIPWDQIDAAATEQGERFILAPQDGSAPVWGAAVTVTGRPELRAVVLRVGSPALLDEIAAEVGAPLRLVNFARYAAPDRDPFTALHSRALADGRTAAASLRDGSTYGASLVVASPTGEVVALLDAELDGAEFSRNVQSFQRWLTLAALAVAAVAGIAGLSYGRWLARPVVALRDVALRFGQGDLSAAIPAVAPTEVGALARTMEDMRRNLTELTDALRRSEAEARAVLGGITEGVYAVDEHRVVRYANPQVMRLLRVEESRVLGRFCGDVLRPRLRADGQRPCEAHCPILLARSGGQGRASEILCLDEGSTRSTVIVSAAPIGGQQVQVIRDETELEAARRARDSVLGNISHEFRTPLAAQLASIEMLRDGLATLGPAPQAELLGNVERGVLRLMRLVDNLLESVRIESGQLDIRRRSVDLGDVIDESIALLGPLFAQRGLRISREGDGQATDDLAVTGDAQRLVQVLVNLLANAIKFAPDGSTVRIGTARGADGRIELWVEDEGPGVPGGSDDAIFGRFHRSSGDEPDAPGLGLGLWIVKSIVERHDGSIRVARTGQQRTRFTVSLPPEAPT
jgi:signal transduction histidine kinase/HAMP domain-containing protein